VIDQTSLLLYGEAFAPTTSAIGFLELPLADVTSALQAWRSERHPGVQVERLSGPLDSMLPILEPLTAGTRPRELLVETAGGRWTAYFDCLLTGTDAVSAIGHLSRTLKCQGLAIRCEPDVPSSDGRPARMGATQFELFGPLPTEFINYVRTVSVINDGGRWRFDANGTVQWFEDVSRYEARRVRSRFDAAMLRDYCRALGVDPFDTSAYGPQGALVTTPLPPAPGGHVMSFAEVQKWLGISPAR
jgi:hypothetical protein